MITGIGILGCCFFLFASLTMACVDEHGMAKGFVCVAGLCLGLAIWGMM